MEETNIYDNNNQEEGIDIIALVKELWAGRKIVIKWTCIFMGIGLFVALFMPRKYKVETVMVPQMESSSKSSLSSLASLAGFDLSTMGNSSDLSPLIYPQIVESVPFRMELMYTPLHYEDVDTAVSMFTYKYEIGKINIIEAIAKYTIGLPYTIKKALTGKKEIVLPEGVGGAAGSGSPKLLVVTRDEMDLLDDLKDQITLMVDKKEGYVKLTVKGRERIQTAELALKAQQLLQDEITRFKIEKSQSELDYIQARYDEVKQEAEYYQERVAVITDRSQNMATTSDKIELSRMQTKYSIANSIYNEMAKQLEQAKMQVKKNTPVFTIIQPVKVPNKSANSKTKILILWTFFGGVLGCGIVLGKQYMPKIKEMFADNKDNGETVNGD